MYVHYVDIKSFLPSITIVSFNGSPCFTYHLCSPVFGPFSYSTETQEGAHVPRTVGRGRVCGGAWVTVPMASPPKHLHSPQPLFELPPSSLPPLPILTQIFRIFPKYLFRKCMFPRTRMDGWMDGWMDVDYG